MKLSNEAVPAAQVTHQNTHSPRFEELAVILPEYLTHPALKQMAQWVQQAMFQEAKVEPNTDQMTDKVQGEIGRVQAILEHLVTTPNSDAAVLVLITNEAQPKLLLTRRAAHLNSHAGEVSFAGGKHDEGDGNNVVTALREACEETALPPSRAQIIGQLPTQISKSGLEVRPIVALVEPPITYVPELGEIERIFWADFEKLITEPTCDYVLPYSIDGKRIHIKTPCWKVDGEVVWGLTGRILASLLEVGFNRKIDWYYQPVDD